MYLILGGCALFVILAIWWWVSLNLVLFYKDNREPHIPTAQELQEWYDGSKQA
jgi:hypothetical protein